MYEMSKTKVGCGLTQVFCNPLNSVFTELSG